MRGTAARWRLTGRWMSAHPQWILVMMPMKGHQPPRVPLLLIVAMWHRWHLRQSFRRDQ